MLNETKLTVSGNVTRPPELKHRRSDGRPFVVVAIASNERRFDRQSQQWVANGVTFFDVICNGSLAANALASLGIGTPVVAHGRFRLHEWETQTSRGTRPILDADSLAVDLTWGTIDYAKGSARFPTTHDDYDTGVPPASEGGPEPLDEPEDATDGGYPLSDGTSRSPISDGSALDADEPEIRTDPDGVVDDASADAALARSA